MEIDKIISGKTIIRLDGELITINPPDSYTKHLAEIFSKEVYDDAFIKNVPLFEELLELTDWSDEDENNLSKVFPKNLDQMKLDYYKRFHLDSAKREIKLHIIKLERRIFDLVARKNVYYNFSCEQLKDYAYLSFIIQRGIDKDVNIERAVSLYQEEQPNQEKIREFSKSSYWRTIWGSSTEKSIIFGDPARLTKPQIELISYSRMYDSVYQSMDCPSEEVIQDDIALDGWFVEQRNKREEESKDKTGKQITGNNANEVFVPVKNKKEAQKITDLNSTWGKNVIKSIRKDLSAHEEVSDLNLSHVKQTINMESSKQSFKGRK
jgi:hypothetical protein